MTTIKTYLPIFTGFYNNIYYEDCFYEQFIEDKKELNFNFEFEDLHFNYSKYYKDVAQEITNEVESILIDLKLCKSVFFEHLVSPKFYNFEDDSINVEITLTDENIKTIQNYLYNNLENFKNYLKKRYTSRDGFISYYSNSFEDWKSFTDNFTDLTGSHYLGSILDFITSNEGNEENQLEIEYKFYVEYLEDEGNEDFLNIINNI